MLLEFNCALKEEVERNAYLLQLLEEKTQSDGNVPTDVKPNREPKAAETPRTQVRAMHTMPHTNPIHQPNPGLLFQPPQNMAASPTFSPEHLPKLHPC
eukprot:2697685-Pyramimonas_sp.AAC.3